MISFGTIIILQLVVAAIAFLVLWKLLDRELEKAAMEKLMAAKADETVKLVNVYHGHPLSTRMEDELKALVKRKFVNSQVMFEQLDSLKGGLIIKIADEVLDFSVSSRIEHIWS